MICKKMVRGDGVGAERIKERKKERNAHRFSPFLMYSLDGPTQCPYNNGSTGYGDECVRVYAALVYAMRVCMLCACICSCVRYARVTVHVFIAFPVSAICLGLSHSAVLGGVAGRDHQ